MVLSKTLERPVIPKLVEVAEVRSVLPVSVVDAMTAERLALNWPPTLSTLETVEEPVTASAVVVAPTAVRPPEKAIWVVVAFEGNGYPIVLVITPVVEL